MIFDMENNRVILSKTPNAHILILGNSGTGKTFFLCRKMEEEIEFGKRIFVFDYSSSYTEIELQRNELSIGNDVTIINPSKTKYKWRFHGENIETSITNAILKSLKIRSYYQKKLLQEAINNMHLVNTNDNFTFPKLKHNLDVLLEYKPKKEKENVIHLLTRIEPYSKIVGLEIFKSNMFEIEQDRKKITIFQLSDFPRTQRPFLVEFLAEILWEEIWNGNKRMEILLFDEFQNLSIKSDSVLATMLREGRKFGIELYLSTQFLGNSCISEKDTLMQAGNMMFFRPTEYDRKFVANLIDTDEPKIWEKILNNLHMGEAVIKGNYSLNRSNQVIQKPIICKVEK